MSLWSLFCAQRTCGLRVRMIFRWRQRFQRVRISFYHFASVLFTFRSNYCVTHSSNQMFSDLVENRRVMHSHRPSITDSCSGYLFDYDHESRDNMLLENVHHKAKCKVCLQRFGCSRRRLSRFLRPFLKDTETENGSLIGFSKPALNETPNTFTKSCRVTHTHTHTACTQLQLAEPYSMQNKG